MISLQDLEGKTLDSFYQGTAMDSEQKVFVMDLATKKTIQLCDHSDVKRTLTELGIADKPDRSYAIYKTFTTGSMGTQYVAQIVTNQEFRMLAYVDGGKILEEITEQQAKVIPGASSLLHFTDWIREAYKTNIQKLR